MRINFQRETRAVVQVAVGPLVGNYINWPEFFIVLCFLNFYFHSLVYMFDITCYLHFNVVDYFSYLYIVAKRTDLKDDYCFICMVLSYGQDGVITCYDETQSPKNPTAGMQLPVSDLQECLKGNKCRGLLLKPKIFMLQVGLYVHIMSQFSLIWLSAPCSDSLDQVTIMMLNLLQTPLLKGKKNKASVRWSGKSNHTL